FTHNSIVQALPLRSYLHCPATAVSSWQYSVSFFFLTIPRPPTSTLFPYTTLFRSWSGTSEVDVIRNKHRGARYEVGAETTTTIGQYHGGGPGSSDGAHNMGDRLDISSCVVMTS